MDQEFFVINGPNGPPAGPAKRPAGPPPQEHQFPQHPPAPPRNMIPVDLRGGPAIQITDVSRDLFSESDMRDELTDYTVFRFDKLADRDQLDDFGRPKWPSWEKALRTEDRSLSKQVAAEKVRHLNRSSKPVIDKKNSLTAPLRRQIDSTLEELMSREPDPANFQWVLAQIDHQLKSIDPCFSNSLNQHNHTRGHRNSTSRCLARRTSHSGGSRYPKKKIYERLSLTAYFKRVPRQGVDILRLWSDKRRGMERMYHPNLGGMNVFPPMQPHPNQVQNAPPQGGRGAGPPPPPPPLPKKPAGPGGAQNNGQSQNKPVNQGTHPPNGRGPQRKENGGRGGNKDTDSASDSSYSDCSSLSRSGSDGHTSPSSVSDRQGRGHGKNYAHGRGGDRRRDRSQHRNVPLTIREHVRLGGRGINSSPQLPRVRVSPRPPVPPLYPSSRDGSVNSDMERIREAYRKGRLEERAEALVAEDIAHERIHRRPTPRIIQERSPPPSYRVRTMVRDDEDIPRRFARLSLHDEDDDVEFLRENARRRREFEYPVHHGSILEEDPFARNPLSPSPSSHTYSVDGYGHRREFLRRYDGPRIIEIPGPRHPLSPQPRRVPTRSFFREV
ncbi:hypothetical protein F5Y19DRAFT_107721 [Xylariaceae sp. FL1651]|nr:hypothetical protein F5Y19DRAFT_107721 [Xylariaceae sp. FL1651]